ncbi:LssY C-terminal domain-containing protein [Rothia sp. P6271]|uniref:LssY C-terminal domain-containing protein n=1 Tax=Rothia sp. P6271 TaxID=3402659 RepID=UPI003ACB44DF
MSDFSPRPFDAQYPKYRGDPNNVSKQRYFMMNMGKRVLEGWADKLYFVFAGIASIWLAVVALIDSWYHSWWGILIAFGFWFFSAYLTLPRFHRIMTDLYVPDYFIGRTRTGDGLLGDPVNIGLRGTADEIHTAMKKAGWVKADPVTLASSWRIIVNTLRKRPYPTAPVSPLYLFHRSENFAYQQEVDGSPSKRHHVRFWKAPEGWKLPGGEPVDWLAAATFDRAVGLSLFTFQITHKIDAETDKERDYVVETVLYCNQKARSDLIEDFSSGYHSRNGGGDTILTDGDLPILDLTSVCNRQDESHNAQRYERLHRRRPWELVEQAPLSVWLASAFTSLVILLQAFLSVTHLGVLITPKDSFEVDVQRFWQIYIAPVVIVVILCITIIQIFLVVWTIRGSQLARKILLALLCFSFISNALSLVFGTEQDISTTYTIYVLMASQVYALLEFTSDGAVNYTFNITRQKSRR